MTAQSLTPFADVLAAFARGEMIVLLDDPDRENEGDLCVLTERISAEQLSFMMYQGRGLICVSIAAERAQALDLPLLAKANTSHFGTPFAVSVDHIAVGSAGVTASGRAATMRALVDPSARAEDFVSPGHVFPLVANPQGVMGRRGQTEGSFDLARLCGRTQSGVICEILAPDGSSARGEELWNFIERHRLPTTTVTEIVRYRVSQELPIRETQRGTLRTRFGDLAIIVFSEDSTGKEHFAAILGQPGHSPLVRVHSECLTGDVFGSLRCDCGPQLESALEKMQREGSGIVLYLRQEGRGIGLSNKLLAYNLQDTGLDTVDANVRLGFQADERDYAVAAKILEQLGYQRIRLLTNNPHKMSELTRHGVEVIERLALAIPPQAQNASYLETKRTKLGHLL
ncbi:MAG: GTP cyclohydrolase II [Bdellovibrionota bacterium]|nr:MAG: GTP cyclohydrolase II [Bdellovibrionota bacterium]